LVVEEKSQYDCVHQIKPTSDFLELYQTSKTKLNLRSPY